MGRHYSPRQISAALQRQEERQMLALERLADWPQGMPPTQDARIGALVSLEKEGLAVRLPGRDPVFGDLRFVLTEAGMQRRAGR
jgi:hypothetical protein